MSVVSIGTCTYGGVAHSDADRFLSTLKGLKAITEEMCEREVGNNRDPGTFSILEMYLATYKDLIKRDGTLKDFLKCCPDLEELYLPYTVRQLVNDHELRGLGQSCPNLKTIEINEADITDAIGPDIQHCTTILLGCCNRITDKIGPYIQQCNTVELGGEITDAIGPFLKNCRNVTLSSNHLTDAIGPFLAGKDRVALSYNCYITPALIDQLHSCKTIVIEDCDHIPNMVRSPNDEI